VGITNQVFADKSPEGKFNVIDEFTCWSPLDDNIEERTNIADNLPVSLLFSGENGKFISVSDYGSGSDIQVTFDQCSQATGEKGGARWYMLNQHRKNCYDWCAFEDPGGQPLCEQDPPYPDWLDFSPCGRLKGFISIIKIGGSQEDFDAFFPNGIDLGYGTIKKIECKCGDSKIPCEYSTQPLGFSTPGDTTCILDTTSGWGGLKPSNKKNRLRGASFSICIDSYLYIHPPSDACPYPPEHNNDIYGTRADRIKGSITVELNERTNFDPFKILFDPGSFSPSSSLAWIDAIPRQYSGPESFDLDVQDWHQTEWWMTTNYEWGLPRSDFDCMEELGDEPWPKDEYCECYQGVIRSCSGAPYFTFKQWCDLDYGHYDEGGDCERTRKWFGGANNDVSNPMPSQYWYRVKVPAWEKDVSADCESTLSYYDYVLPQYMSESGWSLVSGEKCIKLSLGSTLGDFYFYCNKPASDPEDNPTKYLLSSIKYCPYQAGYKTIIWRLNYQTNSPAKILYIYDGDETETPASDPTTKRYYWFDWVNADVYYYNKEIGSSPLRKWHVEFDEKGQLTKYSGGCSSGCGGGAGGFESYEYYDGEEEGDERYEGLVKKKFNSKDDIILQNEYTLDIPGADGPDDRDYVYLPEPLLESQYAIEDPGGSKTATKFKDWEYDGGDSSVIEKTWVSNDEYRVVKYYYAGGSFSDVIMKIEYDKIYEFDEDDYPGNPTGKAYATYYSYESDAGDSTKTVKYPSGKKQSITEYDYDDVYQTGTQTSYIRDTQNEINSNVEVYKYDGNGRVTEYTDARGAVTKYSYNSEGLLQERKEPYNTEGIEIPNGRIVTTYLYDQARRIYQEEEAICDENGGNCTEIKKIVYVYSGTDGVPGLLKRQEVYFYNGGYPVEPDESTEYRYNDFGQQTRVIRSDGVVTGSSYHLSGQLASEFVLSDVSDPNDADPDLVLISQTKYTYDDDGRVEFTERAKHNEEFDFGDPGITWVKTKYEYDFLGRRKAVIEDADGLALKTEYEYNNQGELVKTTLPNGKWTKTERDGRGLVVKQIVGYYDPVEEEDFEAAVTTFKYDANGNMIEKTVPYTDPDGNPKRVKTAYKYDNFDRLEQTVGGMVYDEEE